MRTLRSIAVLFVLVSLTVPTTARAVAWVNLQFQQLSFLYEDPVHDAVFSSYGRCLIDYGKDPQPGFLNVVAMIPGWEVRAWAVRNVPLMDITYGPPEEQVGCRIPLDEMGLESGMPLQDLVYSYVVTPEPLSDEEGWIFAETTDPLVPTPVESVVYNVKNGVTAMPAEEKLGEMYASERVPYAGTPNHSVTSWIGCNMPNVPLDSGSDPMDDSACAPASCANSLAWLDQQHPEIDVPDDQRALLKQLSNLMNRARKKGASNETMARAKLDFIEAHNLPIHVKLQSASNHDDIKSSSGHTVATDENSFWSTWPTESWLKSEAQHGEDVEMLVSYMYKDATGWHSVGGHAVVLSGLGTMRDDWVWVAWKHDEDQDSPSGTVQESGILHDTGDGLIVIGMGGEYTEDGVTHKYEAYLDGVLSESYDPDHQQPPAEEDFDNYCDYITRTIKPGGSLDMDFPTNKDRSFDVTVYQVDRWQEPPTQKLLFRWTKNSGKSRGVSNPTDRCITVRFHNDDMEGDHWWGYDDYTVQISQTKTVVSPDPSNFEETGGFSLGGRDSTCEFGPAIDPTVVVDYMMGMDLDQVPGSLGVAGGTSELFLHCQIPAWNKYWRELGFIVDVLEVASPGDLFVDCPTNGFTTALSISGPGRYQVQLGTMPEGITDFSLHLQAVGGLELTFDSMGVPTLVAPWSSIGDETPNADQFLATNQPNPFNPLTNIEFGLAERGWARLAVYDLQGRRITLLYEGDLPAGPHRQSWDGRDDRDREVAAGVYLYRLETDRGEISKKMTLVR